MAPPGVTFNWFSKTSLTLFSGKGNFTFQTKSGFSDAGNLKASPPKALGEVKAWGSSLRSKMWEQLKSNFLKWNQFRTTCCWTKVAAVQRKVRSAQYAHRFVLIISLSGPVSPICTEACPHIFVRPSFTRKVTKQINQQNWHFVFWPTIICLWKHKNQIMSCPTFNGWDLLAPLCGDLIVKLFRDNSPSIQSRL